MTIISTAFNPYASWEVFPLGQNESNAPASNDNCSPQKDRSNVAFAEHIPGGNAAGPEWEAAGTEHLKAFIDHLRPPPSWCATPGRRAGDSDTAYEVVQGDAVTNPRITARVEAYKRVMANAESIIGNGRDDQPMPNPLTVRAWLFDIGQAFDKVEGFLRETEATRCLPQAERTEKILQVYHNTGIFSLVVKTIQLRLPYDDERAKAKAEALIRYSYANSVSTAIAG